MLRQVHNALHTTRLYLTTSELILLSVAAGLTCASFAELLDAPLVTAVMLLAAAAIIALVYERSNTRRMMRHLSERLNNSAVLDKREVAASTDLAMVDQALNRLIQRLRMQAHTEVEQEDGVSPCEGQSVGEAHMVAVLSIGVRRGASEAFTAQHLELLARAATQALQCSEDAALSVQLQGDGTVFVASGAQRPQPVVTSLRQVVAVAQALSGDDRLRFGLSCGAARVCVLPHSAPVLVGAPVEDAARLSRMATAWHEYRLLCTEPVALLARSYPSQRTKLTLNLSALPALPVYAVDLEPVAVAKSA